MSKYTRLNKINHYHDSDFAKRSLENSRKLTTIAARKSNLIDTIQSQAKRSSLNYLSNERKVGRNSEETNISRNHNSSFNLKFAFFACISLLIIMLIWVDGVQSLNCYHCSSVDNPNCDEAFSGRANITDTDCEKQIGRPAKVCRKIIQYIEDKKVVIRSCGYIDEFEGKEKKSMCYKRSGTFAIMMESCNCYTDNCNHSASLVPLQSVLLLLTSCSVLFYLFTCKQQYHYQVIERER